jgi:hypothetical protein
LRGGASFRPPRNPRYRIELGIGGVGRDALLMRVGILGLLFLIISLFILTFFVLGMKVYGKGTYRVRWY